jgi:hypothetical protein
MRAFGVGRRAEFLWNEHGGTVSQFGAPLHEIHFLLEEPHPDQVRKVEPVWLDIATGRLQSRQPSEESGFRLIYRPTEADENEGLSTFGFCPICTRRTNTGGSLKIMDLATKGEQPFANLIRDPFISPLKSTRHSCRSATPESSMRRPKNLSCAFRTFHSEKINLQSMF